MRFVDERQEDNFKSGRGTARSLACVYDVLVLDASSALIQILLIIRMFRNNQAPHSMGGRREAEERKESSIVGI